MEQPRIRILCIDDHPVVRDGLVAILSAHADLEVIATAASAEQGIELFREYLPDVTLMDLRLPKMGGVEAVDIIRRDFPQARIIVLTTYQGDEDIYRALQAGAATYLLKDTVSNDLVRVIREVFGGSRSVPPQIAASLVGRIGQPDLTPRELEVLSLIAEGLRNKEIAGKLNISEETVQVHVKNVMAKLNVHGRTEAVTTALRRGILHMD